MRLVPRPSPNFNARRAGAAIDILLLHYTGMENAEAALRRLTDPAAKVSAHYTIDEDGTVYRHLDEELRAWHAGAGWWAGETDVNSRSIGIELVNPGHELGYRPFPDAQIASLVALGREIVARHPIPRHRVLGHSDIAPARKIDPGELFPWATLAAAGLGLWPARDPAPPPPPADARGLGADLAAIGYRCEHGAAPDAATVAAFQRHFRPSRVDGVIDADTCARAAAIRALVP